MRAKVELKSFSSTSSDTASLSSLSSEFSGLYFNNADRSDKSSESRKFRSRNSHILTTSYSNAKPKRKKLKTKKKYFSLSSATDSSSKNNMSSSNSSSINDLLLIDEKTRRSSSDEHKFEAQADFSYHGSPTLDSIRKILRLLLIKLWLLGDKEIFEIAHLTILFLRQKHLNLTWNFQQDFANSVKTSNFEHASAFLICVCQIIKLKVQTEVILQNFNTFLIWYVIVCFANWKHGMNLDRVIVLKRSLEVI